MSFGVAIYIFISLRLCRFFSWSCRDPEDISKEFGRDNCIFSPNRELWIPRRSINVRPTPPPFMTFLSSLLLVGSNPGDPKIKWRWNVLPTIQFNSVSIPFHLAHPQDAFLLVHLSVIYLYCPTFLSSWITINEGPCCNEFLLIDYADSSLLFMILWLLQGIPSPRWPALFFTRITHSSCPNYLVHETARNLLQSCTVALGVWFKKPTVTLFLLSQDTVITDQVM